MHHYRKFNPDRIIYQIWIQHQLPNNSNLPGYIAKAYDNAWIEGILLKLAKANVWQKLVAKNTLGIDCSLPLEKLKKNSNKT